MLNGDRNPDAFLGIFRGVRGLYWNTLVLQVVDFATKTLQRLQVADPDATALGDTDALNRRSADARYAPIAVATATEGSILMPLGSAAGTFQSTATIPPNALVTTQVVTGGTAYSAGSTVAVGYAGALSAFSAAAKSNLALANNEGGQAYGQKQADVAAQKLVATVVLGGAPVVGSSASVWVRWSVPKP
jgi:hypothetical protein